MPASPHSKSVSPSTAAPSTKARTRVTSSARPISERAGGDGAPCSLMTALLPQEQVGSRQTLPGPSGLSAGRRGVDLMATGGSAIARRQPRRDWLVSPHRLLRGCVTVGPNDPGVAIYGREREAEWLAAHYR